MTMHFRLLLSIAVLMPVLSCGSGTPEPRGPVPVSIIVPEPAAISRMVKAPCRLEASGEAVLSVLSPGRVLSVLVSAGDSVAAGETLAELSTDQGYAASVSAAAAAVTAARSAADVAASDMERTGRLYEAGVVSEAEYQRVVSLAAMTDASLSAAVAGYSGANSSREGAYITAPFDGVVSRVWQSGGALVSGPLVSISGEGALGAEVLVAETHLAYLCEGLPVFFSTMHYPGEVFTGELVAFSPDVDPVSGLVSVRVQLTDGTCRLRSGMSGTLSIAIETEVNALILPRSVLRPVTGGGWEAAIVTDGVVRLTAVETGISGSGYVQILYGVSFGDSIVALGQQLVEPGDRVRPVGI